MPEHTIAENLQRLIDAKTAIGSAITAKGGTVSANDGLEEFAADIATIPSGGGSTGKSDVNFYDYDGTIVQSYSTADFANLSALPANPTHEGLTAQGWNWSLADAKTCVANNGKLNIGQMYITSDGKTRLYINLLDDYKSPTLELFLTNNSEVDVDWGDGSAHSTLSSINANYQSETHTYAVAGDYIIAITVVSGSIEIRGNGLTFSLIKGNDSNSNKVYREGLYNIEIGSLVTSIKSYAFQYCYSLTSITIPSSVTSIESYAFRYCSSLDSITIPSSVTSIESYAFQCCYSLTSITIPSSVTSIESYAFNSCYSLDSITIPSSVTSIESYAFQCCYSLTSITIPSSVTLSNTAFAGCSSLLYITYLGINVPKESPWGAPNTHVKVILPIYKNYTSAVNEVSSGTTLTTSVSCTVGDLVVATFECLGGVYSIPSDWTLLGDSGDVSTGSFTQTTGMAYKIAESSTESLTISQTSSSRIFTNLIAITDASIGTFSGFTKNETNNTMTVTKPSGLVIWAISTLWWGSNWEVTPIDDKAKLSYNRCENFLDQSDDITVTFTTDTTQSAGGLACASLTITGIDNFWYYDSI